MLQNTKSSLNPNAIPFSPHDSQKEIEILPGVKGRSAKKRDNHSKLRNVPPRLWRQWNQGNKYLVWRAKGYPPDLKTDKEIDSGCGGGGNSGGSVVEDDDLGGNTTTLMIKNIPNHFRREDILWVLDRFCWFSRSKQFKYDFVYLPMELGSKFHKSSPKPPLEKLFDGSYKDKICKITRAIIQGKQNLKKKFENSRFPSSDKSCLPVILSPPEMAGTSHHQLLLEHASV